MVFFDTPRTRRLQSDVEALKELKENSGILEFQAWGDPPERYLVTFRGKGLMRKSESEAVEIADVHRVEIRLGIDYPRSRPDLQWLTSIYHPNISAVGAVCLGGYSTNWVPSLGLAELCEMLWDMVRMANYDPKSAYNYSAGRWCETQTQFDFPIDRRNLRDRVGQTVGGNVIKLDLTNGKPKEAPPIVKPPEDDVLIIDDSTAVPPSLPRVQVIRPAPRPGPPPRPAKPAGGGEDILIIE
ncbi:MAG: ubiquitin--protein ligase [Planctomycetes bacterium]|nr:ubiquitin--protein ligase [Planctomycetota bacterium]